MIKCQVCGYDNPDKATTCLNCGSPLEKQKVSEAIDDISGEATVLIGMPTRGSQSSGPRPAQPPAQPAAAAPPPPPPPRPAAAPAAAPRPAAPAAAAPPPPPPPAAKPSAPPVAAASGEGYHPLAIAAIITGPLSILCCFLGIPLGVAGIITGYLAKDKGGKNQQFGLIGMITGGVGIAVSLILGILQISGILFGAGN